MVFRQALALATVVCATGCFNFDSAYRQYCDGAGCDSGDAGIPAGASDAGNDGGVDGGVDGGHDAGVTSGCDASLCLESTGTGSMKLLRAICGSSPSNVWAVGWSGTWIHWNGTRWTNGTVPLTSVSLYACATTASSVWAGGTEGIFRLSPPATTWVRELDLRGTDDRVYGMQAASDSELYVAGWLHWTSRSDGSSWIEDFRRASAPSGSTGPLYDVSVAGRSVWAVGAFDEGDGIVLKRFDAGDWRPEPIPTLNELADVHAIDEDKAFAVGESGTVLERNLDGGWSLHSQFTNQDLKAVWASSASDVWVGGFAGELWHWNGTQWQQEAPAGLTTSMDLEDIWGSGTTHLFVGASYDSKVGSFGEQFDGGYVFRFRRP